MPASATARFAALAMMVVLVLAACGNPFGSDAEPSPEQGIDTGALRVSVDRSARTLTLRNTTEFVVGYMIVDSEIATIALFPPCGTTCLRLVQGDSVVVPYSAIGGYTANSRRANVLWFKYQRGTDGTLVPIEGMNVVEVAL